MKKAHLKLALVSILSLITFNAYADWQCFAADKNGHFWTSTGSTEDRAGAVAMSFCSAYSPNGDSCQINKCAAK